MHGRIIEARDSKEELTGICEADFYESSYDDFADYIANLDREEDPGEWVDRPGLEWDGSERTLTITDKKAYFRGKFEEFHELANALADAGIGEFSEGGIDHEVWRLREAYDDRFDVHLYGLEYYSGGICTLDDWVRNMPDGTKVYLGNMVDYHW